MAYRVNAGKQFNRETEKKPHITKALIKRIMSYFKPYLPLLAVTGGAVTVTSLLDLY